MKKYIIGKCKNRLLLGLTLLLVSIGMVSCFEPKKDKEKLLPHITVWNHTNENLTVLLLPSGLPLKYSDNSKFYRAAEYSPESVEACYYYYSTQPTETDCEYRFFSFSKTLEIYVFDTNTYYSYSHRELLNNGEWLARIAVTKDMLNSSGGFYEIKNESDEYTITLMD